jgi:cell division protein ZipA
MPGLRWILLGLGVLFCIGLWWWETRRRGQAMDRAADALREFEESSFPSAPATAPSRLRIEPTFGDAADTTDDASFDQSAFDEPASDAELESDEPPAGSAVPPDRIVSMRLFCAPEAPFDGRELVDALIAEGMEHGQFSIFHRHDENGRRLFSVASLLEPGSFDLEHLDGVPFKGVVFFAVQKEAGEEGLAEMRGTAQALAGRLNGNLTAER